MVSSKEDYLNGANAEQYPLMNIPPQSTKNALTGPVHSSWGPWEFSSQATHFPNWGWLQSPPGERQ